MKNAGRTLVVLGVGVLFGGCASDVPSDFGETRGISETSQAVGKAKVDICHFEGNGSSRVVTVADPAFEAHLRHGDRAVSAETCDGIDNDCDGVVDDGLEDLADTCDGIDNNCDGVVDEDCCVNVYLHCADPTDPDNVLLETACGSGEHTLLPITAANISFVVFGAGVQSVDLIHCLDTSSLSGQSLEITTSTNLCGLEGGCCGDPRWNDSVCKIVIH